jgi:hypothetical protein
MSFTIPFSAGERFQAEIAGGETRSPHAIARLYNPVFFFWLYKMVLNKWEINGPRSSCLV